jgi:hypothetical protein
MSIVGCNRYEWIPTSGGGITWVRLAEVKRNGIIFPDTVSSFNINKNDTIEFTVEIELDYIYDDVQLDSISGYIEIYTSEVPEMQAKMDSLNGQSDDFAFSEHVNSQSGNQKIYRTYQVINKVDRPNIYGVDPANPYISLNIRINTYSSPDEGFEKYPDTDIEEFHIESHSFLSLQLNNQYKLTTFRLYNNYIGKDPNDSTGVGYEINKGEYCHDISALYCYYDDKINCSGSCDRTLINLTYDTLYNTSNTDFTPAFGLSHLMRRKFANGFSSVISFAHNIDGERVNYFNWEREHKLDRKYGLTTTETLEVIDPKVGEDYFLDFTSNVSGIVKAYIRIKDIVEDGMNSYVEFDLAVDTRQLPQPEGL